MNETQIRERLREAVGEYRVPIGLSSRVEARLQSSAPGQSGRALADRGPNPWLVGFGKTGSLVAALLVVLLMAALVVGVHALRDRGLLNAQPAAPSVQGPSIKQYQAMLDVDEQTVLSSQSNNCVTLDDNCPTAAAAVVAALQQWLDDLNASPPPARFAYVDAQMRRHIALAISGLNAAVTAYNAKDQTGMDNAITDAVAERDNIESETGDILGSSQVTVSLYTTVVRSDRALLLGCVFCQQLGSPNQMSCPAGQTASCVSEIAGVRLEVETFQGDLVHSFAPDSLATKDARLQADLFAADVALGAMDSALSAGDQAALQTGYTAVRQALGRIDADAAGIVNGR